jgi:hypothetical protein
VNVCSMGHLLIERDCIGPMAFATRFFEPSKGGLLTRFLISEQLNCNSDKNSFKNIHLFHYCSLFTYQCCINVMGFSTFQLSHWTSLTSGMH